MVISLNRERRQKSINKRNLPRDNYNKERRNISSSTISNDDMTTIAEAVVVGVARVSKTNEGTDNSINIQLTALNGILMK